MQHERAGSLYHWRFEGEAAARWRWHNGPLMQVAVLWLRQQYFAVPFITVSLLIPHSCQE